MKVHLLNLTYLVTSLDELAPVQYHQPHGLQVRFFLLRLSCCFVLNHSAFDVLDTGVEHARDAGR